MFIVNNLLILRSNIEREVQHLLECYMYTIYVKRSSINRIWDYIVKIDWHF